MAVQIALPEAMATLAPSEDYTRKDVHDIFDPDSAFTTSAGTWGISGIIRVPSRPGDFVLFVTFGQSAGGHVFDEGITASRVLSWQSQPRQGFQDRTVQELIAHDEVLNSIYLFLRTAENRPYTFLGRLKYLVHDATREHPVYFQWQILDWDYRRVPLQRMNLTLTPEAADSEHVGSGLAGLVESDPPKPTSRKGVSTHTFQTHKVPDHSTIEKQNRVLGVGGEKIGFGLRKGAFAKSRPSRSGGSYHARVGTGRRWSRLRHTFVYTHRRAKIHRGKKQQQVRQRRHSTCHRMR